MCSGMGYALSAFMHPNNSLVAGVCVAMILGGFFNGVDPSIASYKEDNPAMVVACGMSFNRWAVSPPASAPCPGHTPNRAGRPDELDVHLNTVWFARSAQVT
jgi:hypothetical protein